LNWVKQAYPINLTIQDARKMMRNLGDQPSHKMENVEVKAGNPLHSYQRIQQQDASAGEHKEDREPKKPFNPKPE
jgi:membrane protein involved in colicin uptake